jgi:hypothetical protein
MKPNNILIFAAVGLLLAPGIALAEPTYLTEAEALAAGADYAIQGEYVGSIPNGEDGQPVGLQVIAMGNGAFQAVAYMGGLPGAGWTGEEPVRQDAKLNSEGGLAFVGEGEIAAIHEKDAFKIQVKGETLATLSKTVRTSPTMGKEPPAGAVVLFNGGNADAWEGGRVEDGLLVQGCASKEKFGDHTIHIEFRTPFKPESRGQGRGNSGLYMQGRYETQILDSFGLEGKMDETGGVYSVSAPSENLCLPPLAWQTYDIEFTAARFDAEGKKTANARMTVLLNGVKVQDDIEVPHSTTAAPMPEGPEKGPVYLQDHGNPIRFRNVWVLPKNAGE